MTRAHLRQALLAEGGMLAEMVRAGEAGNGGASGGEDAAGPPAPEAALGPPQLAASGPRAARDPDEYELLLEMILEGSRLHYGAPHVVRCEDRDLALLLGDQLYALGLSHLAALGDLEAVAELADLISLVAQAQAAGDAGLAAMLWDAGAAAIGWGSTPEHEAAKTLARAGNERAADALADAWPDLLPAARAVGK